MVSRRINCNCLFLFFFDFQAIINPKTVANTTRQSKRSHYSDETIQCSSIEQDYIVGNHSSVFLYTSYIQSKVQTVQLVKCIGGIRQWQYACFLLYTCTLSSLAQSLAHTFISYIKYPEDNINMYITLW